MNQILIGTLAATGALCLASAASGHGGRYLGPAAPIGGCCSGPTSPGPSGPSAPGAKAASGSSTPAHRHDGPDLTIWDYWWGHNRQAYLNDIARRWGKSWGVGSNDCFGLVASEEEPWRPKERLIRQTVVPALLKTLEVETMNDIVTGSLIALAKIGNDPSMDSSSGFGPVITNFLSSDEQVVAETAALALGILGDDRAVPALASLLHGDEEGQRLAGKAVPFRTRAFAGYALGLIGAETSEEGIRRAIVERLLDALVSERCAQPDIKVSVINALGVIPLEWPSWALASAAPETSIAANRATLLRYLLYRMSSDRLGERGSDRDFRVRAQYPIAVARLLASQGDLPEEMLEVRGQAIESLLELVDVDSNETQKEVQQSACIALGAIGNAGGEGKGGEQNRRVLKALTRTAKNSEDRQAKLFALMALGQMGSRPGRGGHRELQEKAEGVLTGAMAHGKGQEQPWAALALGVYGSALNANGSGVPPRVVLAIRAMAQKQKNPWLIGSYAIALGLLNDSGSQDALLGYQKLKQFSIDDARGQIAVGLGLMQATSAQEPLNALIDKSKYRPHLIMHAAAALGLLSDSSGTPRLVELLHRAKSLSASAAVASAFGLTGDAGSVEPLSEVLLNKGDQKASGRTRAYAAVALGIVCDRAYLPWNLKYSFNTNYHATTSTLTSVRGDGILEIL